MFVDGVGKYENIKICFARTIQVELIKLTNKSTQREFTEPKAGVREAKNDD